MRRIYTSNCLSAIESRWVAPPSTPPPSQSRPSVCQSIHLQRARPSHASRPRPPRLPRAGRRGATRGQVKPSHSLPSSNFYSAAAVDREADRKKLTRGAEGATDGRTRTETDYDFLDRALGETDADDVAQVASRLSGCMGWKGGREERRRATRRDFAGARGGKRRKRGRTEEMENEVV